MAVKQTAQAVQPTETLAPSLDEIPGYVEAKAAAEEYLPFGGDIGWLVEIAIVLLLTTLFSFAAAALLRLLSRLFTRASSKWDDVFVDAMRRPLKVAIWVLGIFYAIGVGYKDASADFSRFLAMGRDIALIMMAAWAAIRYVDGGLSVYKQRQRRRGKSYDVTALTAVSKLLKISAGLAAFLMVLQTLGVSVAGVLAAGGIGGIAIGFAAKDMLANFFGAFIIYFDKPFKVGDWIRSPDQDIEGVVEDIGWRITTIRTLEKRPLYVPNSVFSSISVENPSRMSHRRLRETIGIRYDDLGVMKAIVDDVRTMLDAHALVDHDETTVVNFVTFNSSSCDFLVNCFTRQVDVKDFHAFKQDVMLEIGAIIDKHGAEIAYPTQVEYSLVRDADAAAERDARRKDSLKGDEGSR